MEILSYSGFRSIPFTSLDFKISVEGELTLDDRPSGLEEFNTMTELAVDNIDVLIAVTFQRFHMPPVYWKQLKALRSCEDTNTPESLVLALKRPIESVDYPGYYVIPNFSNYLITTEGVLLKKSTGSFIIASQTPLGYWTYRMTSDDSHTSNQLRHRILCYAFKPYGHDVDQLDVNHKDGIPGNDALENLEWATRTENNLHAVEMGLRSDNKPVQVRHAKSKSVYVYASCSAAGRAIGVTETTVSNRAKTNGYKSYDGLQFRFHPDNTTWPEVQGDGSGFQVEMLDGTRFLCGEREAAMYAGVTRTSLQRLLREGRVCGKTPNKITRVNAKSSPPVTTEQNSP